MSLDAGSGVGFPGRGQGQSKAPNNAGQQHKLVGGAAMRFKLHPDETIGGEGAYSAALPSNKRLLRGKPFQWTDEWVVGDLIRGKHQALRVPARRMTRSQGQNRRLGPS